MSTTEPANVDEYRISVALSDMRVAV